MNTFRDGGNVSMHKALLDMVTTDPDVVSCIERVGNSILLNDIILSENGSPITAKLSEILNPVYKRFFRDALAMSYICGFVAYYIVKKNGIKIPKCVPLGMFTWSVKPCSNKEGKGSLLRYDVRMSQGKDVTVHIYEVRSPVLHETSSYEDVCTPLLGVLNQYMHWKDSEVQCSVSNQWNTSKHLAITERLDLKDQTTSGIQLLDEQRRYNLTGQHNNVIHNNLLRLTGGGVTTSVHDAFHSHIHNQFSDTRMCEVGSKRAVVHIMPPNTEVQELGTMDIGTSVRDNKTSFQSAVYIFFGMPNINNTNTAAAATSAIEGLHREQYAYIMTTKRHMETLGAEAYARSFGVDIDNVACTLKAMPRFEVTSVADIKILWEIGMLVPGDMKRLRTMILDK